MNCNIRIRYKVQGTRLKNVSDVIGPEVTKLNLHCSVTGRVP